MEPPNALHSALLPVRVYASRKTNLLGAAVREAEAHAPVCATDTSLAALGLPLASAPACRPPASARVLAAWRARVESAVVWSEWVAWDAFVVAGADAGACVAGVARAGVAPTAAGAGRAGSGSGWCRAEEHREGQAGKRRSALLPLLMLLLLVLW